MNVQQPDTNLFSSIPRGKISNIIIERITSAIADGSLMPGDRIPTEQEFSTQLGVGRNVVREAIKVLEAFGVVEIRRADGTYVSEGYNPKLLNPLFYGIILSDYTYEELIHYRISLLYSTLFMIMRKATDEEVGDFYLKSLRLYESVLSSPPSYEYLVEQFQIRTKLRGSLCHNPMMTQVDGMSAHIFNKLCAKALSVAVETKNYHKLVNSILFEAEIVRDRAMDKLSLCLDERIAIWMELTFGNFGTGDEV